MYIFYTYFFISPPSLIATTWLTDICFVWQAGCTTNPKQPTMFRNYLKIAWRNIIRQKWTSLINVFGLSVGMTASILLFIYISYETSFDRFHEGSERIYRIVSHFPGQNNYIMPRTFPQVAEQLEEQSPHVAMACRIKNDNNYVRSGEQVFENVATLMVDESFADLFSFRPARGDLRQALADPTRIVLSTEMAGRLFGKEDPLGRALKISRMTFDEEQGRYTSEYTNVIVGCILEPMPGNTHLQFDALMAFEAYTPVWLRTFSNDVFIYLKVQGDQPDLESITRLSESVVAGIMRDGRHIAHSLQPLHDIHFGEPLRFDMGPHGRPELIFVFSLVAVFIIVIAVINFINLVTARTEKRAVEASIRKVAGAGRRDIAGQFLGESVLVSLLSFLLAMVLVELLITPFSGLLDRELALTTTDSLWVFARLLVFALLIGLISGLYPAMVFSRYQPAEIMRGKFRGGHRNPLMRIILVVTQFVISVILIVSITVFNRQVHYMKTADLGFDSENVLVFTGLTNSLITGFDAIEAELRQHPGILSVTRAQSAPGLGGSGQTLRLAESPENESISITEIRIREGFQETYGIELVDGRWIDFALASDRSNFIINETAASILGMAEPVGTDVVMFHRPGKVVGVMKDFHFTSLKNEIQPLILTAYQNPFYNIAVKISEGERADATDHIRKVFQRFDPNFRFEEWYLSQRFESFYRQEEQSNKILNFASLLAVFIAILGLLGLSSYIVMSRKKEIGLRKIHGASGMQIIMVLFRDIGRWVVLANLIAWPLVWMAMERWLDGYPYRIGLSWWFFAMAGLLTLLIAAGTISGQTWKAAHTNPVDALRAG